MRWTMVGLVACAGPGLTTKGTPTGETGATPSTGETGTTNEGQCVYDLGLWCFNLENPPGPSQTTGTCPTVTLDGLLVSGSTGYWAATHTRCTEATHGVLDVVNQPTGYGGPYWYFDATGALVAFRYTTDYPLCDQEGSDGSSYYGFAPVCTDWCWVVDPNGWWSSYPECM